MKGYLSAEQAAADIGMSRELVYLELQSTEPRSLHGFQRTKGARWRIKQECLDAWVEGRQCAHQSSNVVPFARSSRAAS